MMLQKNVAIADLKSILTHGVLSMDESGNNNWDEGRRAKNRTDVVYWARPKTEGASFVNYGFALIVAEVKNAQRVDFTEKDVNRGLYEEYISDSVPASDIISIMIPDFAECNIEDERIIRVKVTALALDLEGASAARNAVAREIADWKNANKTEWYWNCSTRKSRQVSKNIGNTELGYYGLPRELWKEKEERESRLYDIFAEYAVSNGTRVTVHSFEEATELRDFIYTV